MTTAYRCPRCEIQLRRQDIDGVTIEYCTKCNGLCLDSGELDQLAAQTAGSVEYSTISDDSLQNDDGRPEINCPKCEATAKMRKVEFLHHTDIVLDRCDSCGVLWLDTNELEAINKHIKDLNRGEAERSFWTQVKVFAVEIASMGL